MQMRMWTWLFYDVIVDEMDILCDDLQYVMIVVAVSIIVVVDVVVMSAAIVLVVFVLSRVLGCSCFRSCCCLKQQNFSPHT